MSRGRQEQAAARLGRHFTPPRFEAGTGLFLTLGFSAAVSNLSR